MDVPGQALRFLCRPFALPGRTVADRWSENFCILEFFLGRPAEEGPPRSSLATLRAVQPGICAFCLSTLNFRKGFTAAFNAPTRTTYEHERVQVGRTDSALRVFCSCTRPDDLIRIVVRLLIRVSAPFIKTS